MKQSGIIKFARTVSFLFDGSVLAIPVFIAVCFYNRSEGSKIWIMPAFLVSLLFLAVIPYSFILYLYKTKKISDIHIPKRRQRLMPLLVINICVVLGFIILLFLRSSLLLKTVYLIYLIGLPTISLITVFYKVSFHASYITMFSLIYLIVFGKWAIFTLPLIPLVGWSRVRLKRHTTAQVGLGILVILIVSFIIFTLNGFLWTGFWAVTEIKNFFKDLAFYLSPALPGYGSGTPVISILFILLFYLIFEKKQSLPTAKLSLKNENMLAS